MRDTRHSILSCTVVVFCVYILGLICSSPVCDACKFGEGCTYPCYCLDASEACDRDTGYCSSGCAGGGYQTPWHGPACQIGNLALHKPSVTSDGDPAVSEAIVDGEVPPVGHPCTAVVNHAPAWWRVDLGAFYVITHLYIVAPQVEGDESGPWNITISAFNRTDVDAPSASCVTMETVLMTSQVKCTQPVVGRYVQLQVQHFMLKLCEVEVIGYLIPLSATFNKMASQSGNDTFSAANPGSRAVDGYTYPRLDSHSCAHPSPVDEPIDVEGEGGAYTWWVVDMGEMYNITRITIVQRHFNKERLQDTMIGLGNVTTLRNHTLCTTTQGYDVQRAEVHLACTQPRTARYLSVYKTRKQPLNFCEVIAPTQHLHATACTGMFGPGCMTACNCEHQCDHVTGRCPTACRSGWQGTDCQVYIIDTAVIGTAVGCSLAAAVILLLLVLLFIKCRRRQKLKEFLKVGYRSESQKSGAVDPHDAAPCLTGNSGYEELEATISYGEKSIMIPIEKLPEYVELKKHDESPAGLKAEFQKIPFGKSYPTIVGELPENKSKNRFTNMEAYDRSRVILRGFDHEGYINANYIFGYKARHDNYIACIGPKKNTVSDMWLMIWQQEVNTVVMLTTCCDRSKTKSEEYWGSAGVTSYGDIRVEMLARTVFAHFEVHVLQATKGSTTRTVRHYQYTGWPDHGVPDLATSFLLFRQRVLTAEEDRTGPLLVHCSAGVGRSGTYIAIDYLINMARRTGSVDVFGCVHDMRKCRMNMVQNQDQYVFVYEAIDEALRSPSSTIASHVYCDVYYEKRKVGHLGTSPIQDEYQILNSLKYRVISGDLDGLHEQNKHKNRDPNIVPGDRDRPFLTTPYIGSTNYINAVFVDGFRRSNSYIVTQHPYTNTCADLWRLVYDHNVTSFIMLQYTQLYTQVFPKFWPGTDVEALQFGKLGVEHIEEQAVMSGVAVVTLKITNSTEKHKALTVKLFLVCDWSNVSELPDSPQTLLDLCNWVDKWQQVTNDGPVTVMCGDGALRSGLVCALMYMLEQLRIDQEVDIFTAVRRIRTNRKQLISSQVQYEYLYDLVLQYLDTYGTYSNFK